MKFSIITVVYNNEDTISDCIKSIQSQSYTDIEHIIIDGLSTDNTLSIINSYKNSRTTVVSEKDNGIYDAMNKGLTYATGDIIAFLNSDDIYQSPRTIDRIASEFLNSQCDATFGDLTYVDYTDTNKVLRYWKVSPFKPGAFSKGWHPTHLSFFAKRELYEKYGNFNIELTIAADFEIILRFIEKYRVTANYIPEVIGRMRVGGESNRSIKNILKGNTEVKKAFKINDIRPPHFYTVKRLVSKLLQYLK